jgi:hypothetical protein
MFGITAAFTTLIGLAIGSVIGKLLFPSIKEEEKEYPRTDLEMKPAQKKITGDFETSKTVPTLVHDFEDAPMPMRMKFIIGAMVFGVFFVVAVGIQRTNEMKTAEAASSSQVTAKAEPIKTEPEKDVEAKFKAPTARPVVKRDLGLHNWRWEYHTQYHVKYTGKVTNTGGRTLRYVKAYVECSDKSGNYIDSDWTYIDIHALLPGQSSTFTGYMNQNPAFAGCFIQFTKDGSKLSVDREYKEKKSFKKDRFKDRTWVRALQKYLTIGGCDAGKADGLMGPATRTAMTCSGFDKAELTAQVDRWIDGR